MMKKSEPRTHASDAQHAHFGDVANRILDLEAAGDVAGARQLLEEALRTDPRASARVTELRAVVSAVGMPLPRSHRTDLTSRVLDRWEEEKLHDGGHATGTDGTNDPDWTDTDLVVAEDSAWPTPPESPADGSRASHARHRRPRGRRTREWSTLVAVALGFGVGLVLYIANRPTRAPEKVAPFQHALHDTPPVGMDGASAGPSLRLGNAGDYDHMPTGVPVVSGSARLRYSAASAASDGWVFTSLTTTAGTNRFSRGVLPDGTNLSGHAEDGPSAGMLDPALLRARLRLVPGATEPADVLFR